jgi:hypothetical protein
MRLRDPDGPLALYLWFFHREQFLTLEGAEPSELKAKFRDGSSTTSGSVTPRFTTGSPLTNGFVLFQFRR